MVFELIINPKNAEAKPWMMFFVGMFYSSLAAILSLWIFQSHASLVMVFLTVFACIHIVHATMQLEEEKDKVMNSGIGLLKEHWKALSFLMFLFLGFVVSFSLWYIFLPSGLVTSMFSVQQQTITDVNSQITSNAITSITIFSRIFINNIKVMIFCLIFSFFYGSGAIFILSWNASVIGTAVGAFARASMSHGFFSAFSLGLMRYMTHGVFEILAYFIVGLAGGIISIAIINHDFGSDKFNNILLDSLDLIIGGFVVLFVAGLIEVFVTPVLF